MLIRHPPWFFLLLPFGLAPYFLGIALCGRLAKVRVGLCRAHSLNNLGLGALTALLIFGGLGAIFAGGLNERRGLLVPVGCFAVMAGLISGVVKTHRIIHGFGWIGVPPALLDGLPEWPVTGPSRRNPSPRILSLGSGRLAVR